MKRYWVVGGVYRNTDFAELAPGATEERHGPFAEYRDAHKKWAERAWATVDDANARFRIVSEDDAAA
jgi:Domain of unknown function (DUF4170)